MTTTDPPTVLAPVKTEDIKRRLRRLRAWLRCENHESRNPLPLCRDCRFPLNSDETDWLLRTRCDTCACRWLERLLRKAVHRLGRKRTVRALKRLAK